MKYVFHKTGETFQEVLHDCLSNHLIEPLDSFHEDFPLFLQLFRTEVPNKAAVIKI